MLERTLNERYPGSALDHLGSVRTGYESQTSAAMEFSQISRLELPTNTSPEAERIWQWPTPQTPTLLSGMMDPLHHGIRANSHSSPPDFTGQAQGLSRSLPNQIITARQGGMDEIPTATAASFFRIYFQAIHPQYPFLSVKSCGEWYEEWKVAGPHSPITGWPAFFVKMVS